MATVLRFPVRPRAASSVLTDQASVRVDRPTAEVVILPCIRREPMAATPRAATDVLEQLQA